MQGTDALRRRAGNGAALVVAIGLALMAAAPASAQVVEGEHADPLGDQVTAAAGAPSGLDLSGAAVRYDSIAGEVRITYRGAITVGSHSRTTYGGVVSQTASPGDVCGVALRGDALFTGSTFTGSGGGPKMGTALLEPKEIAPIDGAVEFPSEGSIVFVFSSPLLQNLGYRCVGALHARWVDATDTTTDDEVGPFDLLGAPGPGAGVAGTAGGIPTSRGASAVATGGPAPAPGRPLRASTLVVSGGLTARIGPALGGLRGLLGRGLVVPVRCSAACAVLGRITSAGAVVARGSVTRLQGGGAGLRLRVDRTARWSLVHRASVPVTIAVTVAGGDGTSRTVVHRMLLL